MRKLIALLLVLVVAVFATDTVLLAQTAEAAADDSAASGFQILKKQFKRLKTNRKIWSLVHRS